jgi:peptidyl-tRNA hydrolase
VLSQIRKAQYPVIDQTLDAAADAVNVILTQGASVAMNRFNRKPESAGAAE